jgi:Uma2 family endonuclease
MNTELLEIALHQPDAYLFVAKLQHALEVEREQRLHFYDIIDENKKMEFINGEIVFHSPVIKRHNMASGSLYTLANTFVQKHQLGFVGIEKILVSLTRNDYEPDICYFTADKARDFTPKQMRFPAPDWVVEVLSASTSKTDRTTKFQDYAAHGVREYWIIDPDNETVEQYELVDDESNPRYELILKASDSTIRSITLAGFAIPIRAMFDANEHLNVLQAILAEA